MSGNNLSYWKNFWDNQSSPLHRYNTDEWYLLYAKEINLILESVGYQGGSTLETGCGNGALFDNLEIDKTSYVGTDISENLIKIFQERHPELELLCTDSASYCVDRMFSLIFSNGVVQYFSPQQIHQYVENSIKMLNENGILLMANIPDRDARNKFYGGQNQSQVFGAVGVMKATIASKVFGKKTQTLGDWYNVSDFLKYQDRGLEIQTFGSLFHPYRFSIALKKVS
jgi:cyclopropane fatty-acyl-phospholipid synthase-like methyltransferase